MIITDQTCYTGPFLHSRFAYKYFRDKVSPTGNIVAFIAPALVDTGLIDLEDALSKDYIFSDKMIHFCWEIPCIHDGFGAVAFQRLFNIGIADVLAKRTKLPIIVDGDDIMVRIGEKNGEPILGKASVSITYCNNGVTLGHTGINIVAGEKAPSFAFSTNMDDITAVDFIKDVVEHFKWMTRDIWVATSKISVPK